MEYTMQKGWRVAGVILSALFISGGLAASILPSFFAEPGNHWAIFGWLGGGIFMIVVGAFALLDCLKTRVTIDENSITIRRGNSLRTVLLSRITGYRTVKTGNNSPDYRVLVSSEPGEKPLRIPNYLGNKFELESWIESRWQDLDAQDLREEEASILSNEQFGTTEEDRANRLKKAKRVIQVSSVISIGAVVWGFVSPRPYEWMIWALAILPWIGAFLLWSFRGIIRLHSGKKSAYPSAETLFYLPPMVLLIRALLDYDLYDFGKAILPTVTLGVAVFIVWLWFCSVPLKEEKSRIGAMAGLLCAALIYAYGVIVTTNGYYDTHAGQHWTVSVKDKQTSTGRTTNYYLTVSGWGRYQADQQESVTRALYNNVKIGDSVRVTLKEGYWSIPWYYVHTSE